ncbi:MAG: 1,4-alpha-glucan branching enzyme, partial [Monoglobales bacterium]
MTGEMYLKEFFDGNSKTAYEFFGCHKAENGFVFRVWAPKAKSVRIVGDFNGWNNEKSFMREIAAGVWEGTIESASVFDNYKYCIEKKSGGQVLKSDPYAFHTCTRPDNASKVYSVDGFHWNDKKYFE